LTFNFQFSVSVEERPLHIQFFREIKEQKNFMINHATMKLMNVNQRCEWLEKAVMDIGTTDFKNIRLLTTLNQHHSIYPYKGLKMLGLS